MKNTLEYFRNKATGPEIHHHLLSCDVEFVRELSERADIKGYSKKIYQNAERFEVWVEGVLVGLVAIYCNDDIHRLAYITSVSVLSCHQGEGIAANLICQCIEYVNRLGMHRISLEVERENGPAIKLYEKYGFVATDTSDSYITMNLFLNAGGERCQMNVTITQR